MSEESKSILLVEDEAIVAMLEKSRLEQYGYSVTTVGSGEKAIETVKANSPVDLILMDVNLGAGIDGTDAARAILGVRDIPIVFLSSHTEPVIVEKTEKITSYGYVVKSSSITVLDASIKMAFKLFEAKLAEREKERRLTRNEHYLRSVLKTTVDGFWIVDTHRRFLDVNDAYLRLTGYTREEFLGMTINDIDLEDIETTERSMARVKEAEAASFEKRHRTKDGRFLDMAVSVTYLDSDGGRFIGFCRDITAGKVAEAALRASEVKYRNLFNNAGVGMFRTRLDGSEVLEFNEKYLSILGISREESEGKPSVDFWADPKERARMVEILRAEGQVENFECKLVRKDGAVIDCLTSLKLYPEQGILEGSIIDMTERKRLEEELRAKDERLRQVFDAMSEGFSIQDVIFDEDGKPRDLRFVDANPAFEQQTGLRNEDTFGHTLLELFPDTEPYWIERYGKVGLSGEPISFEAAFGPLGKYYRVSAFQTKPGQFGVLFADIAETKRATDR